MSLKRKRHNDDDNEEFGGNMGQVLPVARLPPDFDPATAAGEMDGAVYLALVRRDAQARPHTTRVPNPFLAANAAPTILRVNGDGDDDAALPSDEWRATFERRFRAFRANLRHTPIHVGRPPARVAVPGWTDRDGWWAFINGLPPPSKTKTKPQAKPVQRRVVVLDADALMYDEVQQGWAGATARADFVPTARADFAPAARADFVPAARTQDFVPAARTQADDEWQQVEDGELPDDAGPLDWAQDDDDEPEPEPEPEADELPRPREPSRALLECINHRTTLQLLKHFRHWLTLSPSPPLSHLHARWLFALLAHAAPPAELVADEMSVLRQTAKAVLARIRRLRECADEADSVEMAAREVGGEMAQQRAENGQGAGAGAGEEETAWWLVFAAVAAGFAQRDLWDEARAVLG